MTRFPSNVAAAHGLFTVFIALSGISNPSLAQVPLEPPLVVTASRQEQTIDSALAAVSLITRADIERSQANDVLELLRTVPGVDMVRSGPRGSQTSLFLRGTNSNQVLVLIDGVRVAEAANGLFNWEHLSLAQIERIEIVRGPRAAYYGSDAVGGVIQIFTRRHQGVQASFGGGSLSTRRASLAAGARGERTDGRIALSWEEAGGFSSQNPNGFSFNPDDDGYENFSLSAGGGFDFEGGRVGLTLLHTDAETEFDEGISDSTIQNIAFNLKLDQGGSWRHSAKAAYARNRLTSDFGFFTTRLETERLDFSWRSAYSVNEQLEVNAGIDYYDEDGDNRDNYEQSRHNLGVYSGLYWNLGDHDIATSVRLDDDERFGGEVTGQFSWGYSFASGWRFTAGYGRGFRSPNFNELFSPGFGGLFAGNPDLEPETADNYELGLRYQHQHHQFEVRAFHTNLNQLIDFSGEDFQAVNIQQARVRGLEFIHDWRGEKWQARGQYTLQDTENRLTGTELLRRPDHKASIVLERRIGNNNWLGAELIYAGERNDIGAVALDDYVLFNLRGTLRLSEQWRLEGRVENLLDDNYEPAFGFNGQGRSLFMNLTWQSQP